MAIKYKTFSAVVGDMLEVEYDKEGVLHINGLDIAAAEAMLELLDSTLSKGEARVKARTAGKTVKPSLSQRYQELRQEIEDHDPMSEHEAQRLRAEVRAAYFSRKSITYKEEDELLALIDAATPVVPAPRKPEMAPPPEWKDSWYEKLKAQIITKGTYTTAEANSLRMDVAFAHTNGHLNVSERNELLRSIEHRVPSTPKEELPLWVRGGVTPAKQTGEEVELEIEPELELDLEPEITTVKTTMCEWCTFMYPSNEIMFENDPPFRALCSRCGEKESTLAVDKAKDEEFDEGIVGDIQASDVKATSFKEQTFSVTQEFKGGQDMDAVAEKFAGDIKEAKATVTTYKLSEFTQAAQEVIADAESKPDLYKDVKVTVTNVADEPDEFDKAVNEVIKKQDEQAAKAKEEVVVSKPTAEQVVADHKLEGVVSIAPLFGGKVVNDGFDLADTTLPELPTPAPSKRVTPEEARAAAYTLAKQGPPEGLPESEPHKVYPPEAPDNEFLRDVYMALYEEIKGKKDLTQPEAQAYKKRIAEWGNTNGASQQQEFVLTQMLGARTRSVVDKPKRRTVSESGMGGPKATAAVTPEPKVIAPSLTPPAPVVTLTVPMADDVEAALLATSTVREATHYLMSIGVTDLEAIVSRLTGLMPKLDWLRKVRDLKDRVSAAKMMYA